jgi:hypothetical protein
VAPLSELDRKAILGDKYLPLDEFGDQTSGNASDEKKIAARIDKSEQRSFTAGSIIVIGLIVLVSNLSAISGPSLAAVSYVAFFIMTAGATWLYYLRRERRALFERAPRGPCGPRC